MLVCRNVVDLLCDYLDRVLPSKVRKAFEEHIKDCPECLAFVNTYGKTREIYQATLSEAQIPQEFRTKLRSFLKDRIGVSESS